MKILLITARFPYPLIQGDRVIPYHRLRTLSQKHEITLITFYQTPKELENLAIIRPYCREIHPIYLPKWKSILNVLMGFFNFQVPLQVSYYYSSEFRQKINDVLESDNFDLIHGFLLRIVPYLDEISKPKLLELIDSMQLNLQRRAAKEKIPNRWLFQEELRRIKNYETQKVVNYCEYITVVAQQDKTLITSQKIEVIPNGVDINIFKPQKQNILQPTIIFSGNMSYAPNIHALNWFVKNCLPLIQTKIANATLIIAGANPTKEIKKLAKQKGIIVTGFVDSMVDILNQANVAIAPMQSGSGIQNKILEAMATELPVVTTTLGLGSIQAEPEEEILVTDNPEQFSQYIVDLLSNPQWAKEIGTKARQFVIRNHSWEYAANQIEDIYSKIVFSTLR